jgi:ABC-2 type transport system permease protein
MGNFLSLVSVENIKLWKRFSTKLMVLIIVVVVFGLSGLVKAEQSIVQNQLNGTTQTTSQASGDWKQQLQATNVSLQQQIDTEEKSTVQREKNNLDTLKMEIAKNNYRIENNMQPQKDSGFWDWISSFGFAPFVALLAIIACSGLIAGEFSDGTMKTMISRPFARWQILTAKFIVVAVYSIILMILGYLALLGSIAIFFGIGGAGSPMLLWIGGNVVNVPGFVGSLITNGLDYLFVLVYLIFAFALSAVSRSRALATGLSIFLMFGGSFIALLAQNFDWGKYIFFADTSFSAFVMSGAPFYGITLGLALLICAIYCVGFIFAGYFTFAKRDIS